jgi:plastocyanin
MIGRYGQLMPLPARARRAPVWAGVAAAVLAAAACSNSQAPTARGPHTGTVSASVVNGVQEVRIEATDQFRFHPSTIVVHPGKVRVVLVNVGKGAPHNLLVKGFPADFVPLAGAGQSEAATFTAPSPGSYTFVCTLHTKEGMTGKLVVLAK